MLATTRTFVAIELDDALRAALAEAQDHLRRGLGGQAGRWVNPEGIHLTLKFLGEVPTAKLETIHQAVQRACEGSMPLALTLGGLGCFPNARRPRVVWVGVRDATGRLLPLQQAIESELERLGYAREQRRFQPHLTLARIKEGAGRNEVEALGQAVSEAPMGDLAVMTARYVSVIKSDLRPNGAIYTVLYRAPLGGL